jgi:hypothetical protein
MLCWLGVLLLLISSAVNDGEDRGTGDCCNYHHLDLLY